MSHVNWTRQLYRALSKSEEGVWEQAEALSHLYEEREDFRKILDKRISYRKAMYLIDCYRTFTRIGLTKRMFKKLGWTRAMVLLPWLRKTESKSVGFALGLTALQLTKLVRMKLGKELRGEETLTVTLPAARKTVIARCWRELVEQGHAQDNGDLLYKITMFYISQKVKTPYLLRARRVA
jgi:hypothetical protein